MLFSGNNHINYENLSEALAYCLGNKGHSYISELHLGNGGTSVDTTGVILYNPTQTSYQNSDMYTPTYNPTNTSNQTVMKVVDNTDVNNPDPARNKIEIIHTPGKNYTDILITCLLDYGEPAGQASFDNIANLDNPYVFDEMGIKSWSPEGQRKGRLLTHVVFHPIKKSLNRLIQIEYTIRIQSLTNLTN